MEQSISISLPRDFKKRNFLINNIEKEIERQNGKIILRQLSGKELLIIWENGLTLEETEKLEKEYAIKNRWNYQGYDLRGILFSGLIGTAVIAITIKLKINASLGSFLTLLSILLSYFLFFVKFLKKNYKE